MSRPDTEIQEGIGGWIRVALLGALIAAGPLWFLGTAIVIQLSPDLNGTGDMVDGAAMEVHHISWSAWVYAGGWVAFWMALALPVLLAVITVARFGFEAWRLRDRAERARYDAMVASDAVIDDPDWGADLPEDDGPGATDPATSQTR